MAELQIHANLATAVGAVFIPVCSACVALRLYARRLHGVNLGADDWTIISALVRCFRAPTTKACYLISALGLCDRDGYYHYHRLAVFKLLPLPVLTIPQRLNENSWRIQRVKSQGSPRQT